MYKSIKSEDLSNGDREGSNGREGGSQLDQGFGEARR